MMNRKLVKTTAVAALVLALLSASAWAALNHGHILAQGGVPEQGLPARYVPVFDGAGIDASAILGSYCKSASTAGNTLSVVCQTDTGAEHTATLTSGAGSGGLDRAAVDARVRANVSEWALDGNARQIPEDKLDNAPTAVTDNTMMTTTTLNAHDIRRLDTNRIRVIPAPGPGQHIIVKDITIVKTGSGTLGAGSVNMGLALAGHSGGLLPLAALPPAESLETRSIYQAEVGDDVGDILQDGNYVRYVEPARAGGYLAWPDQPLVVYAQAANPADWATVTRDLSATTLEFGVRYELRGPVSSDAMLSDLILGSTSPDEWTPRFSSGVYDYHVSVPHSTERTSVEPIPMNPGAIFAIATSPTNALAETSATGGRVELDAGATTTVTVTVTAQDGATRVYTVRIARADS